MPRRASFIGKLPEKSGRSANKNVIIATLALDSTNMNATFTATKSIPYSQYINNQPVMPLRYEAEGKTLIMKKMIFGGGSSIVIRLPDGTDYLIAVHRDQGAQRYPNKLDILGGTVNVEDPIKASASETFEEVVILSAGKAIIPKFGALPWSFYNDLVSTTVAFTAMSVAGIDDFKILKSKVFPFVNPFYLDGNKRLTVGFGIDALSRDIRTNTAHILLPPPIIELEAIGSFRESLGVETEGAVPEREVVLIKMNNLGNKMPGVMVYSLGIEIAQYGTMEEYFRLGPFGVDMFTPALASLLSYIGKTEFVNPERYNQTFSQILRG